MYFSPYNMNLEITKSSKGDKYDSKGDENKGCVIKSSSLTLAATDTKENKQVGDYESDENLRFDNAYLQATANNNECADILSSIKTASDINYTKEAHIGSSSIIEQQSNNSKHELIKLVHAKQSFSEERKIGAKNLNDRLENPLKQNESRKDNRNFEKYIEKNTPAMRSDFNTQPNSTIANQQQEKNVTETTDKIYTQIEEIYQQQHEPSTSKTYEKIMNTNQQEKSAVQEEHNQRCAVESSHQQIEILEFSMQQQHYPAEQLQQSQQLQEQQQKTEAQRLPMQQHHNVAPTQRGDHRQHHQNLVNFIHPQHPHPNDSSPLHSLHQRHQQSQIHEVYHDLMMEEFHEDHNTPYKLGLSPSTVKHENQDDGYETSAGDVLTPNSHGSATHSVTPQHHMQYSGVGPSVAKCEEQHQEQNIRLQQSQHTKCIMNAQRQSGQPEVLSNESTATMANIDHYHFIDDDMNEGSNNRIGNILTPPHSQIRNNQEGALINGYMLMQSEVATSNNMNTANDIYNLTNSSLNSVPSQKIPCLDTDISTPISNTEHQHYTEKPTESGGQDHDPISNIELKSTQKRRGRKKKISEGGLHPILGRLTHAESITGLGKAKERKKHDRFNGMSEEEVVKRILPDHLRDNLDIVIIGINPGLFAAYKGHHYAGPGNHFWKCLYLSGLTQEQMNAEEDFNLIKYGIGLTNMVERATKGSADLTRKEIKEGSRILLEKLQRFRPKIAVFNGKLIFEVFSGKKDFNFGRQPNCVEGTDTFIWVMPSSSARCAQLPRAADKVPFYAALKKFRDYLNGLIPNIDQSECVFTEERIKQQCEQESYKNHQNKILGINKSTYPNTLRISNTSNTLQNFVDSSLTPDLNPHVTCKELGQTPAAGNSVSDNFIMSSLVGIQHEKKKRGRPKKIKGQQTIDPVTGNKKIEVNSHLITTHTGDYNNILNLSVVQVSDSDMPKKKRGRPKKIKTHLNVLHQEITQPAQMLSQKPNIMSIQSLTSDITPQHMQRQQASHQHVALYSSPPPHHRIIYSPMASPMASPSLNCSYTTNTPPSQLQHDKLGIPSNVRDPPKTTANLGQEAQHQHSMQNQNFEESPPPSAPNVCPVDFEPPTASTTSSSIINANINPDLNTMHQKLQLTNQRSRFNSPISGEATPDHPANDNFHQWISSQPNHHHNSPVSATHMFLNSPQHQSLSYHEQQQRHQMQAIHQQHPQHQEIHPIWALRHQNRYEDLSNSPYLLNSQTHNQTNHNNQNHHGSNDLARRSLSGLESLVDQIPTISESESIALSSTVAVNAHVTSAASVESRLQGMQNSTLADTQVGHDSHYVSITESENLLSPSNCPTSISSNNNRIQTPNTTSSLLNSNFSVSNLASSSASSSNNITNLENYGLTSNCRPLSNPNIYHHSNLMAAAVLAAASVNTSACLSAPSAVAGSSNHHSTVYMEPHAHLTTHVPVNSIYPTVAPATHHHHSTMTEHPHHSSHYGSTQHTADEYTPPNNPYAATQSNVTTGHTLHMPSPNYPYGYSSTSAQSNYSTYPHSHHTTNNHRGHPHAHHISMFDRLKPSDISGYSTGF